MFIFNTSDGLEGRCQCSRWTYSSLKTSIKNIFTNISPPIKPISANFYWWRILLGNGNVSGCWSFLSSSRRLLLILVAVHPLLQKGAWKKYLVSWCCFHWFFIIECNKNNQSHAVFIGMETYLWCKCNFVDWAHQQLPWNDAHWDMKSCRTLEVLHSKVEIVNKYVINVWQHVFAMMIDVCYLCKYYYYSFYYHHHY